MNTNATNTRTATATATASRPTLRRFLLAGLAPLLTVLAILGMAGQADAASYSYGGKVSINSYYGAASGDATISGSQTSFYVGANLRDVRNDNYCATLQMRGLTNGSASAWITVGFNCDTNVSKFVWASRNTSGWAVDGIQVRACQSNRYGTVVATCSAAVNATNWQVYYG
ncbi:hypothetical protein [Nocardioides rubriscoriae]|uniref:hypothetical protein n=1 Tax=Nocardioides rubriscoriae TaxID=642762 RepID=UPI0011DF4437|nr:hypothetical protein [Nocardioides rubriscoriae]